MADVGSLERMGRELKCPICLSLFRSAVSITCNHIFCKCCLIQSMKSASTCPVCKVPFHRREIRPAPHMDNLVGVFKSMEAAAGASVVSTQEDPAAKIAGVLDCDNSGSKPKRLQKKKVASKKENNTAKAIASSASRPARKPSISKNKRIHVTPFPESETPIGSKKVKKHEEPEKNANDDVQVDMVLTSDKPGSPSLSPFFWLRGDDEERGTAETLSELLSLDTPLRYNAPTFSDIKDSDEENHHNMTPNSKAKGAEIFDSEIFEWSQRPCSPELRSTPVKKQGKLKNILDEITEKDDAEDMQLDNSFDELDLANNAEAASAEKNKHKRKKARVTNSKSLKLTNRGKKQAKGSGANQQCMDTSTCIGAKSHQRNRTKASSRRNKVSINRNRNLCSSDEPTRTVAPPEDGLEVEAPENEPSNKSPRKYKSSQQNKSGGELEIAGEGTVNATESKSEQRTKRMRRILDGGIARKIRLVSEFENEIETPQPHNLIKGCTQHKSLSTISKKSMGSNIGVKTPNITLGRCLSNAATVPSLKNVSIMNDSGKYMEQLDHSGTVISCTAVLKKCDNKVSKIFCAFCQSGDNTEESGEMVHYHNGKQVPAEFIGGANVVHSHKNCLEWAPDVYFEDDRVFNLTTELARSKRIKCACCGIKGAALGCFEISCRKSFHVTCAKLIPECRWDNENFVMLCPLHQFSKLPVETSECKKESKRSEKSKRPSQVPSQDYGSKWTWPFGSPQKWILCCSALSATEKDIVSEFAKIAGVPVSTSWNPSVTHVIASTNQSGACKRTLKFLMAILNGKWIVSIDWVKTCMQYMEPVDEQKFEVNIDVHGTSAGPRLGRHRVINKQPKLFDGMNFYLQGDYTKSYRGYLQDLVITAGGTVLQRKPVSRDHQKLLDDSSMVLIVYSEENPKNAKARSKEGMDTGRRQADAQALALASGGKVVSSTWIIDSIAACNLQPL